MGMSADNSDDMITGINVTPMVDVMLVLLVIFMIAAPSLYSGKLPLELPKAQSAQKADKITMRFSLLKDGKLMLDKKQIKIGEVADLVKKALELDPQADALVAADKSLSHGSVMELVDQLKVAGIQKLAVGVDNPSQ